MEKEKHILGDIQKNNPKLNRATLPKWKRYMDTHTLIVL